tara:strand:+ start:358 stop:546 length:189 start_codon:yes stop_codon:yes gene_type:complete
MFDNQEKAHLKNIVLKALEDFVDLQVNLSSSNAREVIAVRIASDILNAQNEQPLAPEEIQKI